MASPLPAGASLAEFIAEKRAQGKRIFLTSRSVAITQQRCPRKRYLGNIYEGRGITKTRMSAPLATGIYTHMPLSQLLKGASPEDAAGAATERYREECSVRGLDLESTEQQTDVIKEQVALVEAFTHLSHRRVIPQILAEYEILDVEREEWFVLYEDQRVVVVMEARCDALLRERAMVIDQAAQAAAQARVDEAAKFIKQRPIDKLAMGLVQGDLYVLSWKTAASWDKRKAREAKTDMQGISEVYAVELRVGEPVMGAKMIHLLKGIRMQSPKGSGRYIQNSPLVYAWMNGSGPTTQFAWTYEWDDPDQVNDWGKAVGHRLGKGWQRVFIPDTGMSIAEWIEMLDSGTVQPEAGDCLERQFISPMPEPRSALQRQRWLRQMETQELAVATWVDTLEDAQRRNATTRMEFVEAGEEEIAALLDAYFPQYTHSCNYPSECEFWMICHGSEEVDNPITLYQIREPHHPGEGMLLGEE